LGPYAGWVAISGASFPEEFVGGSTQEFKPRLFLGVGEGWAAMLACLNKQVLLCPPWRS
jgi:hypothetical protein